jgi:hypothetical protein
VSPLDEWADLHNQVPDTLYHYTSTQGLLAMLRSGHVWATECRYMQDPRELAHAAALIASVIDSATRKRSSAALDQVRRSLESPIGEAFWQHRMFLMSFCAGGDLLSQWRGYREVGGGYALGFDSASLLDTHPSDSPPRILRRVLYDPTEQRRILEAMINAVIERRVTEADPRFWSFFNEALISFKHATFSHEQEWRLAQLGGAWTQTGERSRYPVQVRERAGELVPYADLDLTHSLGRHTGRLPISALVHGPSHNPQRSDKALRLLLESCGYAEDQVELRASKVPFLG